MRKTSGGRFSPSGNLMRGMLPMRFSGEFAEFESSHSERSKESSKGGSFGFSGHGGLFPVSAKLLFEFFRRFWYDVLGKKQSKSMPSESLSKWFSAARSRKVLANLMIMEEIDRIIHENGENHDTGAYT